MIQTLIILSFAILATLGAQLSLKNGVSAFGSLNFSFSSIVFLISQFFQNVWITLGLALYGVSFLLWLFVISRIQLNIIYPVNVSIQIAMLALISWVLFKEALSFGQVAGIGVILLGIFLLLSKS